jgi:hypothetical protein
MPRTKVVLYCDVNGAVPFREWLKDLQSKARARCFTYLELLESKGHELQRPHADYIRGSDLYELRFQFYRVNYRVLCFFHGRDAVVVSHGFTKEGKIPEKEIRLATDRMLLFRSNPKKHSVIKDGEDAG